MKRAAMLGLGLVVVAACGSRDEAIVDRGLAALAPFKKELRATLERALAQGPEEAIAACAELAPQLAARHSVGGVTLGRTSTKLRNPKNKADAWVRDIAETNAQRYNIVELDDGAIGFTEPIKVDALCVTCHGKRVAPEIRARLAALYPDDQATGYDVGDVRGVFWAVLPSE